MQSTIIRRGIDGGDKTGANKFVAYSEEQSNGGLSVG